MHMKDNSFASSYQGHRTFPPDAPDYAVQQQCANHEWVTEMSYSFYSVHLTMTFAIVCSTSQKLSSVSAEWKSVSLPQETHLLLNKCTFQHHLCAPEIDLTRLQVFWILVSIDRSPFRALANKTKMLPKRCSHLLKTCSTSVTLLLQEFPFPSFPSQYLPMPPTPSLVSLIRGLLGVTHILRHILKNPLLIYPSTVKTFRLYIGGQRAATSTSAYEGIIMDS